MTHTTMVTAYPSLESEVSFTRGPSGIFYECQKGTDTCWLIAERALPSVMLLVEAVATQRVKIAMPPVSMALIHPPTFEPHLHRKAGTERATPPGWTCSRSPI